MSERPLHKVLSRAFVAGFVPEHTEREPWHQPSLERVQHAYTGNVAVVPLAVADRVHLRGLDTPSHERDYELYDWTKASWGV